MKPNYQFDKRQRELEKKKKKEAKALKKAPTARAPAEEEGAEPSAPATPVAE
jgi:hypothetical protein